MVQRNIYRWFYRHLSFSLSLSKLIMFEEFRLYEDARLWWFFEEKQKLRPWACRILAWQPTGGLWEKKSKINGKMFSYFLHFSIFSLLLWQLFVSSHGGLAFRLDFTDLSLQSIRKKKKKKRYRKCKIEIWT